MYYYIVFLIHVLDELARGDNVRAVECYMNDKGVTQYIYQYGDGHGVPDETRDHLISIVTGRTM